MKSNCDDFAQCLQLPLHPVLLRLLPEDGAASSVMPTDDWRLWSSWFPVESSNPTWQRTDNQQDCVKRLKPSCDATLLRTLQQAARGTNVSNLLLQNINHKSFINIWSVIVDTHLCAAELVWIDVFSQSKIEFIGFFHNMDHNYGFKKRKNTENDFSFTTLRSCTGSYCLFFSFWWY